MAGRGAEIRKVRKVRKIKHKKERQKLTNDYKPVELQEASALLYASPQLDFPQVGRVSLLVSGNQLLPVFPGGTEVTTGSHWFKAELSCFSSFMILLFFLHYSCHLK